MRQLIIIFAFPVFIQANAQVDKKNAVFAELGGSAYYYSINYERSSEKGILLRAGIGTVSNNYVFPVLMGKCFGKGVHHIEVTAGITFASGKSSIQDPDHTDSHSQNVFATAFIGYRYQKPETKFLFRIGYTPLYKIYDSYSPYNNPFYFQWGGISFGYRF